MNRIQLLLAVIALSVSSVLKAGENITNKELAGNWKMTDVRIINSGSAEAVTKDNCYLCDLYKAELGLVFTTDGKVDYSNYGNPNSVQYSVNGNVLSVFSETDAEIHTPETTEAQNKKVRTSVEFNVSLSNNVLTLTRVSPDFTEVYTLTK